MITAKRKGEKMEEIYDAVIVGGGPAGISAGIYLKRAGKNVVIVERMAVGGQLNFINKIANYPGFVSVDGATLAGNFNKQIESLNIPVIFGEITDFDFSGKIKKLKTRKEELQTRSVILAVGGNPKELEIEGEKRLKGRGVSYCAECDGNFFKGKNVAVIGSNQIAIDGALYLSGLCKKVYFLARYDIKNLNLGDLQRRENITIIQGASPQKIEGEDRVEKCIIMQNGQEKILSVDGIFIIAGNRPNTQALQGKIELTREGYILCDENLHTSQDGVFACGDVRKSKLKQIVTAVSDGALAAIEACAYLTDDGANY